MHVLLDDLAGTSLIAGFAWSRWDPEAASRMRAAQRPGQLGMRKGRIICSGLRPDGHVHTASEEERENLHDARPAAPLSGVDDPWAWHLMPERPPVAMRRHRRIDVWRGAGEGEGDDGDELVVDEFFRDSCWEPDGSEIVLHEYAVSARIDAHAGTLIAPSPRRRTCCRSPSARRRPATWCGSRGCPFVPSAKTSSRP